jgi:hypothetical protein
MLLMEIMVILAALLGFSVLTVLLLISLVKTEELRRRQQAEAWTRIHRLNCTIKALESHNERVQTFALQKGIQDLNAPKLATPEQDTVDQPSESPEEEVFNGIQVKTSF